MGAKNKKLHPEYDKQRWQILSAHSAYQHGATQSSGQPINYTHTHKAICPKRWKDSVILANGISSGQPHVSL